MTAIIDCDFINDLLENEYEHLFHSHELIDEHIYTTKSGNKLKMQQILMRRDYAESDEETTFYEVLVGYCSNGRIYVSEVNNCSLHPRRQISNLTKIQFIDIYTIHIDDDNNYDLHLKISLDKIKSSIHKNNQNIKQHEDEISQIQYEISQIQYETSQLEQTKIKLEEFTCNF